MDAWGRPAHDIRVIICCLASQSASPKMPVPPLRLGVNVDHVATLRNARGGERPDPVRAALAAIEAGADRITPPPREGRRPIPATGMGRPQAGNSKPPHFQIGATPDILPVSPPPK